MTKVLNPAWKIVIIIQVPSKFQFEMKESEISKLIIIKVQFGHRISIQNSTIPDQHKHIKFGETHSYLRVT